MSKGEREESDTVSQSSSRRSSYTSAAAAANANPFISQQYKRGLQLAQGPACAAVKCVMSLTEAASSVSRRRFQAAFSTTDKLC